MNADYLNLSNTQLALAAALILINGILSLLLKLGLTRRLLWASVRTVVQLLLVGHILSWVFRFDRWYIVIGLMMLMTVIAGLAASRRGGRTYRGMRVDGMVSIWLSSWLVTMIALFVIIRIRPWYEPQYAIPILGMILGNTLTGVSLGLERMTEELLARREQVDLLLSLGATRWEAARQPSIQAVRAGMIPTLNAMSVVGVVSLPGMMTGQVLAGQSPLQAVRYQIVIMFLIAAASALGTTLAVLATYWRLFSPEHRFRAERLVARTASKA
jgi:putative ABC transport system permease protein